MRSRTRILTKHAKTNTNEYENENEYENVTSRNSLAIALSRLAARLLPETASRTQSALKLKISFALRAASEAPKSGSRAPPSRNSLANTKRI